VLYVVDTSVFLSDPRSLERLEERHIVLPLVVLAELEAKRTHPELGYPARQVLKTLEMYRKSSGNLRVAVPTSKGGSVRVEVNHIENKDLPDVFKTPENDNRILAVAYNLAKEGEEVTLLTKDLPLRLRASILDIPADGFNADDFERDISEKTETIELDSNDIDDFRYNEFVRIPDAQDRIVNSHVIVKSNNGSNSALGRVVKGGLVLVKNQSIQGLDPRNSEQRFALDVLCDTSVGIVSLGGRAGSGKTMLALAAGMEAVRTKEQSKVIVFRPVYAVGGQDLGFLPGTAEEKMAPWAAAVYDAMEGFMNSAAVEQHKRARTVDVLPLTHLRGRTLNNSYVIIDEAQNLDMMTLVTALSRIGRNSKIVLTHDVNQRDNFRVGKYDGIARVINTLYGSPLFAHVSLNKSERSAIAELVSRSFDL
jgi:PhoH-like ATPase